MKDLKNTLPITHPEMTRFNIPIEGGVKMIFHALEKAQGGEIFIPKIPSYRILDIAEAIGPECEKTIIGVRPGEKIHEEMITAADSLNTYDLGEYFVILPNKVSWDLESFLKANNGRKVPEGFRYNSGENTQWETVESLRNKISKYLDTSIL